ncbi:cation:proton antiporter [Gammaproteobacteria bacterium]|nr:cation:proton antiporter [Gammaproteobacteria bacterium]
MFDVGLLAVLVTMLMALARGLLGPSLHDRVLALNSFGTATVLFIAVLGFFMGRPQFLDIALVYALINYVGTMAVLKYFKYGSLSHSEEDDEAST